MEALDHSHRQDDQPVFMGLERTAQHIRHIPNHARLFGDIRSDCIDPVVCHISPSSNHRSIQV